jgi:hypothetical protein
MNTEAIGEGRLLRSVQGARVERNLTRQVAKLEREESTTTTAGGTAAGDPRRLRGLPAIGRNVSGAIPGTDPVAEALR